MEVACAVTARDTASEHVERRTYRTASLMGINNAQKCNQSSIIISDKPYKFKTALQSEADIYRITFTHKYYCFSKFNYVYFYAVHVTCQPTEVSTSPNYDILSHGFGALSSNRLSELDSSCFSSVHPRKFWYRNWKYTTASQIHNLDPDPIQSFHLSNRRRRYMK